MKYRNKALFFIMLVLLGIDSQFAMVDVLVAAALDEYPHIFRKGTRLIPIHVSFQNF